MTFSRASTQSAQTVDAAADEVLAEVGEEDVLVLDDTSDTDGLLVYQEGAR